jgi:Bacterial capsule synthesis protein PGA_cap
MTDAHPAVPGGSSASVVGTGNVEGLGGFHVMSLANNHAMDAGSGGLRDTMQTLATMGIRTTGAGPDLAAALTPAVLVAGGLRVAVLAVTAVLQHGAQARPGMPGVAPLVAEDVYLPPYPGMCTPGVARWQSTSRRRPGPGAPERLCRPARRRRWQRSRHPVLSVLHGRSSPGPCRLVSRKRSPSSQPAS